jgi:HlyD family secretion protein
LKDPSSKLRPGMSCTGDIITNTKRDTLVIPIQALTVRDVPVDKNGNYLPPAGNVNTSEVQPKSKTTSPNTQKKELEGVFVIDSTMVARFRVIKTGITGESEIEVLDNLKEGEEIVSGSFQTLRTLKEGAAIKIDKSAKSSSEKKS